MDLHQQVKLLMGMQGVMIEPGILDKSWEELGVIINGTLDNIASGEILTNSRFSRTDTTRVLRATWEIC
jgi:hypothetical protein